MSVDQIVEYCWWYLEHLQLILAAGAIFDIICWTAIAIYLNKRRVHRSVARGSQRRRPRRLRPR